MIRRCRSSITHPQPLSYNVPKDAALRVISSHLEYLLDKKNLIEKMFMIKWERVFEGTYLNLDEREFFRSWPKVDNQIDALKEVEDEISSTENQSSLIVVTQHLQDLHHKQALISEAEEYLCLGISLGMSQEEAISCKSEVVHQIDVLEKIFKEISMGQLPLTGAHQGRQVVEYQLPPLLMRLCKFRGFADISEHGESAGESFRRCKAVRNLKFRPSMNENESREVINVVESSESLNKRRYLCVTSGFEIFCLDLKESNDQTFSNSQDVPFIPRIATLDLLEENRPTFAGLFKWRSNAYMIGGESQEKPKAQGKYVCTPFRHCACTHTIKGTSCLTYGLSLASDGAALSHSQSNNIWKLMKPKLWPIVEEINGQIHVIDSAPVRFDNLCRGWLFSHEVFNPDTGSWAEEIIPKLSEDICCVMSYLVLGDRIYATACGRAFLMFDSNKKKWEARSRPTHWEWLKDESSVKEVWHILERGRGRCVGRFPFPCEGELCDPLYVVIAIEKDFRNGSHGTHTVAYLVTSKGQILCRQPLIGFFKGPVWPCLLFDSTIIQADEEDGKTILCSIVKADPWDDIIERNYIFINIFGVEMVSDAAPMVRQLVAKGSQAWPGAFEQEFVRVHTKDSYVYKTDAQFGQRLHANYWAGVQACFL